MSHHASSNLTLGDLWGVLLRFKWRFVVPAFALAAAVLMGSLLLPRKYKAECLFERRTDMVLAEIISRGAPQAMQDPPQTLMAEVAGPPAIDELVATLDTTPALKAKLGSQYTAPRLRQELSRKIAVSFDISSKEVDRVRVSFIADNAELGRLAVNQLVHSYIERTRQRIDQKLQQSSEFFATEVKRSQHRIEELQNRKLVFEIQHAELLPEHSAAAQATAVEVQDRFLQAQQACESAKARAEALRKALATTPASTPVVVTTKNPELADLEKRLRETRATLATNLGVLKMTEKHPDIAALREQVAELERKIQETPAETVTQKQVSDNPKRAELELLLSTTLAEAQSLEKQTTALKAQLEQLTGSAAKLFPVRSDYLKLTREIEEAQRQLTFWEDNLRRVAMTLTAESGNRGVQLDFIKPCEAIAKPVSPNLTQVLAAAVVLGLLAGGLNVFFAYRADDSFNSTDALARDCGLPLLGSVSEIISARQRRWRRVCQTVFYPVHGLVMAGVLAAAAGLLYLDLEKPGSFQHFKQAPARFLRQTFGAGSAAQE